MTKIEWKKTEPWYSTRKKARILTLPDQHYFLIDGLGDPNQADFAQRVQTLYPLSYAIRMSYRNDWEIDGYQEYTVYPLQGHWSIQEQYLNQTPMKKDYYKYTIGIKQPEFVTAAVAEKAKQRAAEKVDAALLKQVRFETIKGKQVGQILHVGPFDEEPVSFAKLEDYLKTEGYQRVSHEHDEIYLSDPRKTAPEKMKTILQVEIKLV